MQTIRRDKDQIQENNSAKLNSVHRQEMIVKNRIDINYRTYPNMEKTSK